MGRLNLDSAFEVAAPTALLVLLPAAFKRKDQDTYNSDKECNYDDDGHGGYPRTAHTTRAKIPTAIRTSTSATRERNDPDAAIF